MTAQELIGALQKAITDEQISSDAWIQLFPEKEGEFEISGLSSGIGKDEVFLNLTEIVWSK